MKVLDLFAGIGGFSLSAHWMGWQTVAFVEKEPFCQKVLRKNFGQDIEIHDDIFTFSGKPFRGRIDIVTGGFPCQPFSAAGKRKGRADERHLFPQMLRVIREVKPRWVVAENVRGLLSIESGSVFAEVITSLEGEGYEVVTFCVPASAVEAPHRRDRLWIVAHSNDAESSYSDKSTTFNTGRKSAEIREPRTVERQNGQAESTGRTGILDAAAHSDRDASNTNNTRSGTSSNGNIGNGSENGIEWCNSLAQLSRQDSDAADASECGLPERGPEGKNGPNRQWSESPEHASSGSVSAADTCNERLQRRMFHSGSKRTEPYDEQPFRRGRNWDEHWFEAATRLCSMANGLPGELVRPRGWRVNALKAAGNSIVPQIAFEIFKAIEAAEKDE